MPSTSDIEPAISPPPALGPPIIGTDTPGSAPGIVQPQYKSGSATSPATPIGITGAPIIPTSTPPGGVGQIGDPIGFPTFPPTGANTAPVAVPIGPDVGPAVAAAAVPPSIAGQVQPQYKSGSATVPTAASLFPEFSTTSPSPPIVFANIAQIGTTPPPITATTAQITISTAPAIPQLPWTPPPTNLPVNTVRPAVTGTTAVGSVLTTTTGTWTGATSYAYQWLREGFPIAGATASTYTLAAADVGEMISVIVTATGTGGVASASSVRAGPITPHGAAMASVYEASAEYHEARAEHHEAQAERHQARADQARQKNSKTGKKR